MGKHLLGLVWGLPESFSMPSLASCRRALAYIRPQPASARLPYTGAERRRSDRRAPWRPQLA